MLSFMHEAEPYGHLRINGRDVAREALARMIGSPLKGLNHHLDELEAAGVFSRTETGTIFSRRMVRDEELRIKRGEGGRLSLQNPAVPKKKDGVKDTFPPSIAPSFGVSPSSSSSSSSSFSQKTEKDMPPAVEGEFEELWTLFPTRNGKRVGKPEALRKYRTLSAEDRQLALVAVRHYANSELVLKGVGIMDLHRFLQKAKWDQPWRDWIEPEQRVTKELHHDKHKIPRTGFTERDYREGAF